MIPEFESFWKAISKYTNIFSFNTDQESMRNRLQFCFFNNRQLFRSAYDAQQMKMICNCSFVSDAFFISLFLFIIIFAIYTSSERNKPYIRMFRNLETNLRRQALFPYYTDKCEDGITPSHARVYCTSCLRILHQKLYICGGGKAYCVACFAGANLSGRCYVIKASFARQESPWIAIHQVLLLDLMQIHGFDNWQDISQGLQAHGLNFSSEEVEFHYYKYILPLTQMLPTQTCIESSWNLDSQKKGRKKGRKDEEEQLIGYNPRRKEFYQEYNPQLENYIENLQFRDDDTVEDEESKFALLQAYCSGLEDRYKKYDFILEHKLLHPNEQNLKNTLHLPEAEKMLSCFRKYTSYAEYIKLRENLVTMMKILSLIGHFQEKKQKANENNPPGKVPRKRVHTERQNTLQKLQITEDDLQKIISLCRGRNGGDTLTFRGINVTLLKQLKK